MNKRKCAVFTMVKNEDVHLPRWVAYYRKHFADSDIYIIDHESDTPTSTDYLSYLADTPINIQTAHCEEVFNHDWLRQTVTDMLHKLLKDYEYVLFAEVDELVMPLNGISLRHYIDDLATGTEHVRCIGIDVINHDSYYENDMYDKTLLNSKPVIWEWGYHKAIPNIEANGDLLLVHLHKYDYDQAFAKHVMWSSMKWNADSIKIGSSIQNQWQGEEKYKEWFNNTRGQPLKPLPRWVKEQIPQ